MSKDKDFLVDLLKNNDQASFDFGAVDNPKTSSAVSFVTETPEGYGLFKVSAPHGGDTYYTDQYGVPMEVWDTGVSNLIAVFAALEDTGEGEVLWNHIGEVFGYK